MSEAQTALQSLPFVSTASVETNAFEGKVTISWRFTGEVAGHGGLVFDENGILQVIRIRTIGLLLGEVVDAFGIPEKIWADYFPGDGVDYNAYLYYPAKGVVIGTHDKPAGDPLSGTERITRDLKVYQIQFFASSDIRTFLEEIDQRSQDNVNYILAHLQPWPGFGDNVIRVEFP